MKGGRRRIRGRLVEGEEGAGVRRRGMRKGRGSRRGRGWGVKEGVDEDGGGGWGCVKSLGLCKSVSIYSKKECRP